ncbi:hypothetical protein FACS1894156_6990 [Bacteroidia bacterium]|nr:hypothetical protein FACS1894156_6990 [Bacteroidia bacterium]
MKYKDLPLPTEKVKRLENFARMYKFGGIVIEPISFVDNRLIVRAEQKDVESSKILSKSDLEERARDVFLGEIPEDWKLTISAVNYSRTDIENVTPMWINTTMSKYGIKPKHITTYTGIDKSTVSTLLNGEKELTKWHKTAFYYLFKYIEHSNFDTHYSQYS